LVSTRNPRIPQVWSLTTGQDPDSGFLTTETY
jgi:hypothetical protein